MRRRRRRARGRANVLQTTVASQLAIIDMLLLRAMAARIDPGILVERDRACGLRCERNACNDDNGFEAMS